MYKVILFDLDDTLIDFKQSEKTSLILLHQTFYPACSFDIFETEFKRINSALWKRVGAAENALSPGEVRLMRFDQLNEKLGCHTSSAEIAAAYEAHLGEQAHWLPGVKTTVEFLKSKGHVLGIVTNGLVSVQDKKYERLEFGKWFDCYVISDRVGVAKPQPGIFRLAIDELVRKNLVTHHEVDPSLILMVGDTINSDGLGAASLQMPFCFIHPSLAEGSDTPCPILYQIPVTLMLPLCLGYDLEYIAYLEAQGVAGELIHSVAEYRSRIMEANHSHHFQHSHEDQRDECELEGELLLETDSSARLPSSL